MRCQQCVKFPDTLDITGWSIPHILHEILRVVRRKIPSTWDMFDSVKCAQHIYCAMKQVLTMVGHVSGTSSPTCSEASTTLAEDAFDDSLSERLSSLAPDDSEP